MDKLEFLVLEGDNIAERIVGDSHDLEISHSESEIWSSWTRGEKVGSLKDTGNNVKIKIGDKKLKLNYSEFCYLHHLIVTKMYLDPNMSATTEILKKD